MKQTGMLVVSLRGANFGFLVSLRVFRAKRQYFLQPRSHLGFREERHEHDEELYDNDKIYDIAFKN